MPTDPHSEEPRADPGQSVSEVVARVLDQLSVSAWLPSGVLVFALLLIGNVRAEDGDLGKAIAAIGRIHFPAVVLLAAAIIVATVVTQAFEFETIRLLEGYWKPGRLRNAVGARLSQRHQRKRDALERRRTELVRRGVALARTEMRARGVSAEIADVVEAEALTQPAGTVLPETRVAADAVNWRDYAPVQERTQLAAIDRALRDYPSPHLILPTRLGNTLMAYEELLHGSNSGPFEGVVLERLERLPAPVRREHDQFRSRIDLYCTLLLVFLVTGIAGVAVLATPGTHASPYRPHVVASILVAALALAFTALSYRAAVVSARKYGYVLSLIAELDP
jgi:hypothetical protein